MVLGNYQDLFMLSSCCIIQCFYVVSAFGFLMTSVVAGNVFLRFPSLVFLWIPSSQETFVYGFCPWLFMVFVVAGKFKFECIEREPVLRTFIYGFRPCLFYGFRRRRKRFLIVSSLVFLGFPCCHSSACDN